MSGDLFKQIDESLKPYAEFAKQIAETMRPTILAIDKIQKQFAPVIQIISFALQAWVKENAHVFEAIQIFVEQAKVWQGHQKQNVVLMAEKGWFPNWNTFFYEPPGGEIIDIDSLMSMHLIDSWEELTGMIIALCPNREHILRTAFKLHLEKNYIASIPLFISQADGIFCEEIKTFLFAGDKPKDVLEKMLETGDLQKGFFERSTIGDVHE